MKFFTRIQEKASAWRLPVRIPVPNRDNLIAMGLMALAFGLMVGVAIGPALGAASNAVAGVVAPLAAAPPAEPETDTVTDDSPEGVELGSPAGSESGDSTTVADNPDSADGFSDSSDGDTSDPYVDSPDVEEPADETPAKIETDPDDGEQEETPEGTELKGAVIGVDPDDGGYDVADSSGNVLALHSTDSPAIGEGVVTRIESLANGTFAEVGEPKAAGLKTKSKLRGTITWIDPATKLATVSSRGSSLAVDLSATAEDEIQKLESGSPVEAVVLLGEPVVSEDGLETRPGLAVESVESTDDPLESFDLNGQVTVTPGTDRQITVTADGAGLIPAELTIDTPEEFDPGLVKDGKTYNLSVERDSAGGLTLIGLSADYNAKVAADPAAAFGTHA